MKKTLLVLSCLTALSAHATCHNGATNYPACDNNKPPVTPTPTPVAAQQEQSQQQQQGQAQAAVAGAVAGSRSGSRSSATGGSAAGGAAQSSANAAGAGAGAGAGSGQTTVVSTGGAAGSGDTYKSLALALPSVPMTPPSFVAGAVVTTTVSACGPLQRPVAEAVYGEHNGLFSNSKVWLGNTERTEIYLNERGEVQPYTAIGGRWFGHQVIYSTAALGVSSASNLAIGGGSGGGWGSGGGGSSGAMQRLVTTVQLRFCDVGAVPAPVAPIAFAPAILQPARRPVPRRAPIRKVLASAPADPACMASAAQSCQARPPSTVQFTAKR